MSKCECCKEENSDLITYKGYKMCPACYMGYVRKVKVCENNAKYETEIDQLKQELEEKDREIERLKITKNNAIECAYLFKVALSVRQKDLAIQELEKVKAKVRDVSGALALCEVEVQIDQQIKELSNNTFKSE